MCSIFLAHAIPACPFAGLDNCFCQSPIKGDAMVRMVMVRMVMVRMVMVMMRMIVMVMVRMVVVRIMVLIVVSTPGPVLTRKETKS